MHLSCEWVLKVRHFSVSKLYRHKTLFVSTGLVYTMLDGTREHYIENTPYVHSHSTHNVKKKKKVM